MTLSSMKTAAARTLTEMNTAESRKPHLTLARSETHDTLRNCVRRSLADYFNQLEGEPVSFALPSEALAAGISIIEQELSPVPAMTVAENIYLGREPTTWQPYKPENPEGA